MVGDEGECGGTDRETDTVFGFNLGNISILLRNGKNSTTSSLSNKHRI